MRRTPFIENADQLKQNALERRNRGLATGKSAPGWDWKRPEPERGSLDEMLARTWAQLQASHSEIRSYLHYHIRLKPMFDAEFGEDGDVPF